MATPNWHGKNLELIREASRHGEAMLAAQVQIATSADQRASVLAGIYAAMATGIMGAIAAHGSFAGQWPLAAAAAIAALAYLIGAGLCIAATLPVAFWPPGNQPSEWYSDIETNRPLEEAVGEQAAHFDQHIAENNQVLSRNARRFLAGAVIGITAPLSGLLAAGAVSLLLPQFT